MSVESLDVDQCGSALVSGLLQWRGGTVGSRGSIEVAEETGVCAVTDDSLSPHIYMYIVTVETDGRGECAVS